MTLSGDNITTIVLAIIGSIQTIALAAIVRRTKRIRETVDVVEKKVSGVASSIDKVHALVNSQHSELKGELKKANEFTDAALKMVVNREGMPPDTHSGDD